MHNQSPLTPRSDHRSRREAYRPVMIVALGLMVAGLLAFAFWPAPPPPSAGPPGASTPPGPVAGAPPSPAPPSPPAPAQSPPQPLPSVPAGEPSRLVVNGDRSCRQVALTYDAGSGADGAAAILDVLKKHNVRATFFLTGKWVERYSDLARRVAAEGHEIGNHTYSHPDLTKLPAAEALDEIRKGEATIRQITGKETRPLFREPFGAFNDEERRVVRQAGFDYSVYWDVDTLDWQFPPLETLTRRIMDRPQNGSVVLMHLNVPDTALASDQAIPALRQKGFQLVTVGELLRCK